MGTKGSGRNCTMGRGDNVYLDLVRRQSQISNMLEICLRDSSKN